MITTFSIVSCCVCRDIFRLNPCENFKVNKFVQSVSPLSFIDDSKSDMLFTMEDLAIFDWSNFVKRNVYLDFHGRKVLENHIFQDELSDFLILDLCELRFQPTKIVFPDNKEIFVTATKYFKLIENNFPMFPKLSGCAVKEVELSQSELHDALDRYIAIFRKYYKDKQIIIINNYPVPKHLDDKSNEIAEYNVNFILKMKNLLQYCYQYIEDKYPNINVIDPPKNALGSVQHLWGKDPLHFVDDYYEYLFKAIKIITEKGDNQKKQLNELKEMYEKYFNLLAKQKRMEYFIQSKNIVSLLSNSTLFVDNSNNLSNWKISLSKESAYDKINHHLSCNDESAPWAILSQDIDKNRLKNKTLTFSVKYETLDNSILNIAFIGQKSTQKKYLYVKQIHSNFIDVESITFTVPTSEEYSAISVSAYINKPHHSAIVYETKLEEGNTSTLF